jgi:DNA-binding PadR family transcriptional regulator
MRIDKDLVAASATPLVLAILTDGGQHGYGILRRVRELSGGRMAWTDGMLYPLLHRLEAAGHISASWGVAENGRRRKVYSITASGEALLADRREQWAVVADALRAAGLSPSNVRAHPHQGKPQVAAPAAAGGAPTVHGALGRIRFGLAGAALRPPRALQWQGDAA